ncbi:MAG: uroporphyrinogen-III synthase [Acidimicrobiia bacterium]|nr:uroporphyrinogen-III synthase [Acidimicrobiia bacterium]
MARTWVNDGPLAGRRIVVTADRRAAEQHHLLDQRGASVQRVPLLGCELLPWEGGLEAQTRQVLHHRPAVVVVTTGTGLWAWLRAADRAGLGDALRAVLDDAALWARGPKAASAVRSAGLRLASSATTLRSADVFAQLTAAHHSARVVLIMDGAPVSGSVAHLVDAGIDVTPVSPYRWVTPDPIEAANLATSMTLGAVDAVTFSTARSVEHLVAAASGAGVLDNLRRACARGEVMLACTGANAAARVTALGLGTAVVPPRHGVGAMVRTLEAHLTAAGVVERPAVLSTTG